MQIFKNFNYIDTSNAYSGKILIRNEYMFIPYININLTPKNTITNQNSFVDFSYFVFKKPQIVEINNVLTMEYIWGEFIVNDVKTEHIMITNGDQNLASELEIQCQDFYFVLMDKYSLSKAGDSFIPINTPNFQMNMDADIVEDFFCNRMLPSKLLNELSLL